MATTKRNRRRILIALLLMFVLGLSGIALAAHLLVNTDRVRVLAESAVAKYTGIDLRIGRLHASLFTGRVTAADLTLAVPDGSASIDRVVVDVDLRRLLARELSIARSELGGLVLHLPDDPQAIADIIDRVEQTVNEHRGDGSGPPAVAVAIAEITAAAHVYLRDDPAPFAAVDIRIEDLLTARIGVHADAALLAWGEAARLYGGVELLRAEPGSPWQADGSAWLRGVQTERLPLTNPPDGVFAADMEFMPTDPGPGAEVHARLIVPSQPEITSSSSARGVWTGERFDIAALHWQSGGARLEAAGSFASIDDWRLSVREANASEVSLDAILALFEQPGARFEADPGAQVTLAGLEADSVSGDWHIARGDLAFNGITVVSQLSNPARRGIAQATRGLRGAASAADGRITIREIRSDDAFLSGTLFPDRANKQLRVDLQADLNLANLPWTLLNEHGDVEEIAGRLSVTKLTGTFARGSSAPDDLSLEGALRDARLVYRDDVLTVDAREVSGSFSTNGSQVATTVRAVDAQGAPLVLAGNYDVKGRTWAGSLEADPSRIVPPLLASLSAADTIYSGTTVLGSSVFDLRAEFPAPDRDAFTLYAVRRDDATAAFDGRLTYAKKQIGIDARATVPVERLLAEFLPNLRGRGPLQVAFSYDKSDKRYTLTADAGAVALESDSILNKAAGTPLSFAMNGATAKSWTVESFEARVHAEPALRSTGPMRDGLLPFEARLGPLAAFLPEGATAGGAIRGTLRTDSFGGDFQFDDASIALTPEIALDRIHGDIRVTPEVISCEALEIDGARSDATITLSRINKRWSGSATGKKLDVEAIAKLVDAARAFRPAPESDPAASGPPRSLWAEPIIGEFTVNLDEFYYNRGRLQAVAFRVLGEARAIRVPEFSARTGDGTVLGSFVVLPGDATDAVVKSAVKWSAFDGKTFSNLLFREDRGFFGVLNGELTFDAPFGDYKTMLAGASGSIRWAGNDGSLGSVGAAGKLLTALRATEIIMLKVPSLKDQGLTYKTWNGEIVMTNGVMNLKETQLDGGAYAITGTGTVDFAAEQTNVETFTRVLESVGKVVGSVPIIGNIATAVSTDLVGVPVNFSGSPYDLKVSVVTATGKSVATAPLRAGEGVLKAVGEGLRRLIPGANKSKDNRYESPPGSN